MWSCWIFPDHNPLRLTSAVPNQPIWMPSQWRGA
jgi:hypothetical protein